MHVSLEIIFGRLDGWFVRLLVGLSMRSFMLRCDRHSPQLMQTDLQTLSCAYSESGLVRSCKTTVKIAPSAMPTNSRTAT